MLMGDCNFGSLPEPLLQAHDPVTPSAGYKTRVIGVTVPNAGDFAICSLLDRQQYWDPEGEAERLGISPALWPLFGMLWPSSVHLAQHLALRPICPDETILEIGCGLALASLVAHKRGARITASDCHPLAQEFLRANLQLNDLPHDLEYLHGQWGLEQPLRPEEAGRAVLSDRYDLIIASDVVYEREAAPLIAKFIDTHAQPEVEVWIVDANRGYRPAFNREMAAYGMERYDDIRLHEKTSICQKDRPYKGRLLKYRRL